MVDYARIPQIVDALLAEDLKPSAGRVRERLGSGSFEVIQREITRYLQSIGHLPAEAQEEISLQPALPASYSLPEIQIDPQAVAKRLEVLRLETYTILAEADAERFHTARVDTEARVSIIRPGGFDGRTPAA